MEKQNFYSEKALSSSSLKSLFALVWIYVLIVFLPQTLQAANTNECPSSIVNNGGNSITINYATSFGSTITSVTINVSSKGTAVYSGSAISSATASSVTIVNLSTPASGVTTITSSDNADNLVSGDGNDTKTCATAPLPVKLISFNGLILTNNKIQLNWITVSELNNDRFEIEKSINGHDFVLAGTVKGNGNSNQLIHYEFVDNEFNYEANIYYRLRQVDYDGNFEYSPIIMPKSNTVIDDQPQMVVYPNPANSGSIITIDLKNLNRYENNIIVSDIYGKVIYQSTFDDSENILKLENIKTGFYTIVVCNRYGAVSKKLMVKN